jgi:hypothetical protein
MADFDDLGALAPRGVQVDAPAKKRGGMFGGVTIDPTAFIAAFAAGMGSPAGAQALEAIHRRRLLGQQQALQEQQYQRERQDKRDDFVFEQDYRTAHPAPYNNDTVADYGFIRQTLGDEAANQFLQSKTNPVVMTPYGPMPYSSVMPQAPTKPVGPLTPIDEGGPGLGGPGGFPRPF